MTKRKDAKRNDWAKIYTAYDHVSFLFCFCRSKQRELLSRVESMARERVTAAQEEPEDFQLVSAGGDIERSLPRSRAHSKDSTSEAGRSPTHSQPTANGGAAEESGCRLM